MEFLKNRSTTSKLAMGLLLGSSLFSASAAIAGNTLTHSTCSSSNVCSNYSYEKCTSLNAQTTSLGSYPCVRMTTGGKAVCGMSSNNNAYCSTYQCSTNPCSSYMNEGSCLSAAVTATGTDTSGTTCVWAIPAGSTTYSCAAPTTSATVNCGSSTPTVQ